ncbi:MAG: ATP-binding protein [Coleofasciculus sp. A1-SPW-01]|uniref:AAA family ATPase n=1 Tax=Coleofasciculus sp. A1-SPW-01 TaxID=3070819 RepID=UPI0033054FCE
MICHFLIGSPSSGKSTLAAKLTQLEPKAVIVSTDAIRAQLFGDENIQGDWSLIETQVLQQIHRSIADGNPVIYDATNAKPEWRRSLLPKISGETVRWIAWYLTTPLETCKVWNRQRQRQVPDQVIEDFYRALRDHPPQTNEGFLAVNSVNLADTESDIWQMFNQSIGRDAPWRVSTCNLKDRQD